LFSGTAITGYSGPKIFAVRPIAVSFNYACFLQLQGCNALHSYYRQNKAKGELWHLGEGLFAPLLNPYMLLLYVLALWSQHFSKRAAVSVRWYKFIYWSVTEPHVCINRSKAVAWQ